MSNKKLIEFLTFREIGQLEISNLTQNNPSSFNSCVKIRKYKVIIEEIIEPREVLCYRLEELWINEHNHHNYQALKNEAEQLRYKFKGEFGSVKREE